MLIDSWRKGWERIHGFYLTHTSMKIWEWSGDANEHTPLFYDSANGKASRGNWKVTLEVKGLLQRILGLYHISRNLCIRYFHRLAPPASLKSAMLLQLHHADWQYWLIQTAEWTVLVRTVLTCGDER